MSVRTVYRDLTALQEELPLPVWGEDGVWGIDDAKAYSTPCGVPGIPATSGT